MACKIDYIDNINLNRAKANVGNVDMKPSQIEALREKHLSILKDLTKSGFAFLRSTEGELNTTASFLSDAESVVSALTGADAYDKTQEVFLEKSVKNPKVWRVGINVLNSLSDQDKVDFFGVKSAPILSDEEIASLSDQNTSERLSGEALSNTWDSKDKTYQNWFEGKISDFKKSIEGYLNGVGKSPIEGISLQPLKDTLKLLQTKGGENSVQAVGSYVIEVTRAINKLAKLYVKNYNSLEEEDKLNNIHYLMDLLKDDSIKKDERQRILSKVSNLINNSREYSYLYKEIDVYVTQMKQKGFEETVSGVPHSQNLGVILENAISEKVSDISKDRILEKFLSGDFQSLEKLMDDITKAIKANNKKTSNYEVEKLVREARDAIRKDIPIPKSPLFFMSQAKGSFDNIKRDVEELNYDVAVEFIFPEVEKQETDSVIKMTRSDLRNIIKSGSLDEGVMKFMFDAAVHSTDPYMAVTAKLVGDTLYKEGHARSIADARMLFDAVDGIFSNGSGIGGNAVLDGMPKEARDALYDSMTHMNLSALLVDGEMQPVDADWTGKTLTINVFGKDYVFKALETRSFFTEKNKALFKATKHQFYKMSFDISDAIKDKVYADGRLDWDVLLDELSVQSPYYVQALEDVQRIGKEYFLQESGRVTTIIKNSFFKQFARENFDGITEQEKEDIFQELGFYENGSFKEGYNEKLPPSGFLDHFSRATAYLNSEDAGEGFRERIKDSLEFVPHKVIGGKTLVFLKINDKFQWLDVSQEGAFDFEEGTDVRYFSYKNYDIKTEKYGIEYGGFQNDALQRWNELKKDSKAFEYHNLLFSMQQAATKDSHMDMYNHGTVGQIAEEQQFTGVKDTFEGWWSRFREWLSNAMGLTDFLEKDIPQNVRVDLTGDTFRSVPLKFSVRLEDKDLEKDLFRSTLALKASSNNHKALKSIEPQLQILRKIVTGDTNLSIKARDTLYKDKNGVLREKPLSLKQRNNEKMVAFLDDIVYGMSENDIIQNVPFLDKRVNVTKMIESTSKFIAITNLTWKIPAMLANLGIGNFNNYGIAVSQGNEKHFLAAKKEYYKNLPNFAKDLMTANIGEKSFIQQLVIIFDAHQGEFLNSFGAISRKGSVKETESRILMATMNGAEHEIQTTLMIQMMMSEMVGGKSLWQHAFDNKNGSNFNGFPSEVTPEILEKFRNKLHNANSKAHGLYSKINKSMAARAWYGKLFMVYKKYLYPTFAARFQNKQFDWEIGEDRQGYVSQYFQILLANIIKDKHSIPLMAWEVVKNFSLKPTLGAIDTLTWGKLSKASVGIDKFLYGGFSTEEKQAAVRTQLEIGTFLTLSLFGFILHGLTEGDDDDEAKTIALKNMELLAKRLQGDMGIYLPYYIVPYSPLKTQTIALDNAWRLVTNPFAQLRTTSNVMDLFSQMKTDIAGTVTGEGLETYSKGGYSYDKGDYKILNKAEKIIPAVSSFYNFMQFLTPQEQLSYINMVRRTSK